MISWQYVIHFWQFSYGDASERDFLATGCADPAHQIAPVGEFVAAWSPDIRSKDARAIALVAPFPIYRRPSRNAAIRGLIACHPLNPLHPLPEGKVRATTNPQNKA